MQILLDFLICLYSWKIDVFVDNGFLCVLVEVQNCNVWCECDFDGMIVSDGMCDVGVCLIGFQIVEDIWFCIYSWDEGDWVDLGVFCMVIEIQMCNVECKCDFDGVVVVDVQCNVGMCFFVLQIVEDYLFCFYLVVNFGVWIYVFICLVNMICICELDCCCSDGMIVVDFECISCSILLIEIENIFNYFSCMNSWEINVWVDLGVFCMVFEIQMCLVWCKWDFDGVVQIDVVCDVGLCFVVLQINFDYLGCSYMVVNWIGYMLVLICLVNIMQMWMV